MISCAKLAQIGVALPEPLAPRGDSVPDVVHRGVVYVSGQLCFYGIHWNSIYKLSGSPKNI